MKKIALSLLILASTSLFASSTQSMVQKCIACHGSDFSKAPLGKTNHIVKGKTSEDLYESLISFRTPKEGDSGEILMQGQIKNFTDEQLKEIAKYISSL